MHLTPEEIDQRAAVVREACTWIGTPYQHQAGVKGAGADCGMLLARVFVNAGLVPTFDPRSGEGYSDQWFLHRDEERYLAFVQQYAAPIETPMFGDIVVFLYGRTFSHGAIVVSWPMVVHASAPARCVLMEDIEKSPFAGKTRKSFSVWAKVGK
jgi:cell wall-associated NlpC family hydrolase